MNTENFNAVIDYFKELNIELPTEVRNSIEDVFHENDDVEGVECYHLDDREEFEKDLSLVTNVSVSLEGWSTGLKYNVWTYYGLVNYSLKENINLVGNSEEDFIEEITPEFNSDETLIENPADYVITLLEKVEWDTRKNNVEKRELNLCIYCPISIDGETPDDKYKEIYDDIKNNRL